MLLLPLLAVSCSKQHGEPAGDVAVPAGVPAVAPQGGVAGAGVECLSVYHLNDAARARDALLKFLTYLDKVAIDAGNRDAVFSEKALALARLGYVNKALSRSEVDWSAPVAALRKTNYAKRWPDDQAQSYLRSIIMEDAKYVSWINADEMLKSIPEDWMLSKSRDNGQKDADEMEEASPPAAENSKSQNPKSQKKSKKPKSK